MPGQIGQNTEQGARPVFSASFAPERPLLGHTGQTDSKRYEDKENIDSSQHLPISSVVASEEPIANTAEDKHCHNSSIDKPGKKAYGLICRIGGNVRVSSDGRAFTQRIVTDVAQFVAQYLIVAVGGGTLMATYTIVVTIRFTEVLLAVRGDLQ
jgi:hypothetical protein